MNTIDAQIEEALDGIPQEGHAAVLRDLLEKWRRRFAEGKVPPGTMWVAEVLFENRLERLGGRS